MKLKQKSTVENMEHLEIQLISKVPKNTPALTSTQENKEQDSKEAVKVSTDILVKLRLQILIGQILSTVSALRFLTKIFFSHEQSAEIPSHHPQS